MRKNIDIYCNKYHYKRYESVTGDNTITKCIDTFKPWADINKALTPLVIARVWDAIKHINIRVMYYVKPSYYRDGTYEKHSVSEHISETNTNLKHEITIPETFNPRKLNNPRLFKGSANQEHTKDKVVLIVTDMGLILHIGYGYNSNYLTYVAIHTDKYDLEITNKLRAIKILNIMRSYANEYFPEYEKQRLEKLLELEKKAQDKARKQGTYLSPILNRYSGY